MADLGKLGREDDDRAADLRRRPRGTAASPRSAAAPARAGARPDQGGAGAAAERGGAAGLLRGDHARQRAPDPERRDRTGRSWPEPRRARRADALDLARGRFCRRSCGPRARRCVHVGRREGREVLRRLARGSTRRCRSWPRPPTGGSSPRTAGRRRPAAAAARGGARPPRALPVSRLSYSGLEAYRRCALPLLPRARRCGCGRSMAAARPMPRASRRRSAERAGARHGSCTSCSSSSTSSARAPPAAEAGGRAARGATASASRAADVEDLAAMVERFARLAAARADRRGAPRPHRAAVRVHARARHGAGGREPARATGWWTCTRPSDGANPRSWSTTRATRSTGCDPAEIMRREPTRTQRLVYALAALRSGGAVGRGRPLLPGAPGRAGGRRVRGGRRCRGSRRAARAGGGRHRGPLRAHRRSRTASCAATAPAGRRSAAGTRASTLAERKPPV